jgi:hypothetical protein
MCKDLGTHVKKINGISDGGVTGITSSRYISVSISVSLLSAFSKSVESVPRENSNLLVGTVEI